MTSTKVDIFEKNNKKYIRFIFYGHFDVHDAEHSLDKWKEINSENPAQKYTIIWDCLRMTGYDHDSRVVWQSALNELKSQIDVIWIITRSKMFKMGAAVMTLMTDIKLKAVETEDDIVY